jgi:hypothetical protein
MATLFYAPHCRETLGEADPANGQGQPGIRLVAACRAWRSNPGDPLLALIERLATVMAKHQLGLAEAAELVAVQEGDTPE